ncbi:MAG: peptidase M50 [marine bacterium B5-7]|nr:MAG: peptidase M50 [marine bacterium B5-7]
MNSSAFLQQFAVVIIPLIFAIVFHEVAHGYAAYKLGDPTAKMLGRLSLNPAKHIDPIGTLLVPMFLLFSGGFLFGWAKPVPVTERNLRKPRRDGMIVALAGPLANILMAIVWAGLFKLLSVSVTGLTPRMEMFLGMCAAGISLNLVFAVLNLLPIPPLDGSRILAGLLPPRWTIWLDRIEPYGLYIMLALLMLGLLHRIMVPMVMALQGWLVHLFHLPVM